MSKYKCLIVDDSTTVRKAIHKILESFPFELREAEDGQKALNECHNDMPDVILLDWNMPVMSGIEFLKKLRQEPNGKHPKVVFCTTENDLSRIREALTAGADEYIMKPFDKDIISEKLDAVGML